jgi:hypothetical protein
MSLSPRPALDERESSVRIHRDVTSLRHVPTPEWNSLGPGWGTATQAPVRRLGRCADHRQPRRMDTTMANRAGEAAGTTSVWRWPAPRSLPPPVSGSPPRAANPHRGRHHLLLRRAGQGVGDRTRRRALGGLHRARRCRRGTRRQEPSRRRGHPRRPGSRMRRHGRGDSQRHRANLLLRQLITPGSESAGRVPAVGAQKVCHLPIAEHPGRRSSILRRY